MKIYFDGKDEWIRVKEGFMQFGNKTHPYGTLIKNAKPKFWISVENGDIYLTRQKSDILYEYRYVMKLNMDINMKIDVILTSTYTMNGVYDFIQKCNKIFPDKNVIVLLIGNFDVSCENIIVINDIKGENKFIAEHILMLYPSLFKDQFVMTVKMDDIKNQNVSKYKPNCFVAFGNLNCVALSKIWLKFNNIKTYEDIKIRMEKLIKKRSDDNFLDYYYSMWNENKYYVS
jgi:hypothetical protein